MADKWNHHQDDGMRGTSDEELRGVAGGEDEDFEDAEDLDEDEDTDEEEDANP
jgi:hypothetical protein